MHTRSKRLEWSESALDELCEGIVYYAERNPVAAQRMLGEINQAAHHWLQLRFPAKASQGDLLERENWLLVHAPRTFWFLQKQNIRNLPYKYCVLCIPPENSHNSEPRSQHLIYWLMCRYGLLTMNANGKKI